MEEENMQTNLDEIGKEKEKTLADSLIEIKENYNIELVEKVQKIERNDIYAVNIAKQFNDCFQDFMNKFKIFPEAKDIINKLMPIYADLEASLFGYGNGILFGDSVKTMNIEQTLQQFRIPILEFVNTYDKVKCSGKNNKKEEFLNKLEEIDKKDEKQE